MEEEYAAQTQDVLQEIGMRLHDIEERQRLLKDRILLIGKTVIEEREKRSASLLTLQKDLLALTEDNTRLKDLVQRMAEQLNQTARKEELSMLQRQFALFRTTPQNHGNH